MKLVIAGYGFVGKAHYELLKDNYDITIVDPAFPEYNQTIPQDADAVIICVATPQDEDGSCYMQNVFDVLSYIPSTAQVLIKSTISIEGWDQIKEQFPNHLITFSPEFLRAASAVEDFKKQTYMYIGGEFDNAVFWEKIFRTVFPQIVIEQLGAKEAILIKYFRNSFLATKVAFFNQVYDLCEKLDLPYYVVQRGINSDARIGKSHTEVTEERGFGGHCFPKDTSALVKTAHKNNINLSILEEAISYNDRIKQ